MHIEQKRLRQKGWSEAEIAKTEAQMEKVRAAQPRAYRWLEKAAFLLLLVTTLTSIFAVSFTILPALLVMQTPLITGSVLVLLGLSFGGLYALLVADITWLKRHHQIIALLLLFVVGIINIWFIVDVIETAAPTLESLLPATSWLLAILFAVALVTPTLISLFYEEVNR